MDQHLFIFSEEKKFRWQRHLVFWIFWWLFFGILYSYTAKFSFLPSLDRLPIALVDSLFFLTSHMFLTYSLMYFVIPRYVIKGLYVQAIGWILLLFIMTACISAVIGTYFLPIVRYHLFDVQKWDSINTSFLLSLLAGLRGGITIGGLAAAIKLMKHWYIKNQRNMQLQNENTAAQLQLLKAQVHPHFLFNTLNNIYSYTQTTSPVAAKMITSLSDLLRFILYESDQTVVSLEKELKLVKDYIELEEIRYGNKLDLQIDLPDLTNDLYIAPLLLLPLIENCFKHGTSQLIDHPWISLSIQLKGQQMKMKLINGKAFEPEPKSLTQGIGIENVIKRLSLIYPGRHELTFTNEADVFIVNLRIELQPNNLEQPLSTQTTEMVYDRI